MRKCSDYTIITKLIFNESDDWDASVGCLIVKACEVFFFYARV